MRIAIENSEALNYAKKLFPSLEWKHYSPLRNPDTEYGCLVGEGNYIQINVELFPVGAMAELSVGHINKNTGRRVCCLRMSPNLQGISLEDALKPIKETWDAFSENFT